MPLPYQKTTTGDRALGEIQKILRGFGCSKFGSMSDDVAGTVMLQFEYRGRPVSVTASMSGYAAAWLKEHPYGHRMRCSRAEHERKALDIASVAVYSMLRDWVKSQITIVETGIMSFEAAFLGSILLPSGKTIMETMVESKTLKLE